MATLCCVFSRVMATIWLFYLLAHLYAFQGSIYCVKPIAVWHLTVDGYTSHVYCTYICNDDWQWHVAGQARGPRMLIYASRFEYVDSYFVYWGMAWIVQGLKVLAVYEASMERNILAGGGTKRPCGETTRGEMSINPTHKQNVGLSQLNQQRNMTQYLCLGFDFAESEVHYSIKWCHEIYTFKTGWVNVIIATQLNKPARNSKGSSQEEWSLRA